MQPVQDIRILLVEDDVHLSYLLMENLSSKGFEVMLAKDGRTAMDMIDKYCYDLCIIDVMLPGVDGFTFAERLRRQAMGTAFIFVTARVQEQDRVHGFELGAEDYIVKPFSFKELYYRILVALRRKVQPVAPPQDYEIAYGEVVLNPSQRTMQIGAQTKKLSHRESGLLQVLLEQKGRYVTRSEILKRVWGNDDYFTGKSMDVYVTRLRKLLKDAPSLEVENLYGTGYRIVERVRDNSSC